MKILRKILGAALFSLLACSTLVGQSATANLSITVNPASGGGGTGSAIPDTMTVSVVGGASATNAIWSRARVFQKAEIQGFPQPSTTTVGCTMGAWQADVRNRWPDGSVRVAGVSFVLSSVSASTSCLIGFSSASTGSSTGSNTPLTQAQMLAAGFNFDAQIQGTGGAPTTSARAILSAASSCTPPGTDPSGPNNGVCRYWRQGPVVTSVILEDRSTTRTYDFDPGDGTKSLHPIFECDFYPLTSAVHCGYSVEDSWVSSSNARDMRDETWGFTLTGGNTGPTTFFNQASFKQIGGSRWHKQFCINGPSVGALNECGVQLHTDYNFAYLMTTHFYPYYDPSTAPTPALLTSTYSAWTGTDQTIPGTSNSGGNGTVGNYLKALGSAGQANWIGPDQTWSVLWIYSMDDRMFTTMIGNEDLVGWFPWHYREADASAGSGHFFDAPSTGSVVTNGRVVSVNARQAADSTDPTFSTTNCGSQFASDAWSAGTLSFDGINGENIDPSHTPASGYTSYTFTGEYFYLEEAQLHAAYEMMAGEGCDPSPGSGSSRQLSLGVTQGPDNIGGPRGPAWWMRTVGEAAFISPDNSPEQAYFESKLLNAIAADEGAHNVAQSNPNSTTAYSFGHNTRLPNGNGNGGCGTALTASPLGLWWCGNAGQVDGSLTARAGTGTKFWMENFYVIALGMLRDFGYPTDNILRFMSIRTNAIMLNSPGQPGVFLARSYVVPGMDTNTNNWVQTWGSYNTATYFNPPYTTWDTSNESTSWDNAYQAIAYGAYSYMYPYTDTNGLTGSAAWNAAVANIPVTLSGSNLFSTVSPKFSILPRPDGYPQTIGWIDLSAMAAGAGLTATIRPVAPSIAQFPNLANGAGDVQAVIQAWSSAAADTKRNVLVNYGGGHNDYFGNEIYSINLEFINNAQLITRSSGPSSDAGAVPGTCYDSLQSGDVHLASGYRNSSHSGDGGFGDYVPTLDKFVWQGGVPACTPGNFGMQDVYYLDPAKLNTSNNPWILKGPTTGTTPSWNSPGLVEAFNPNDGNIYYHDYASGFYRVNPSTLASVQLQNTTGIDYHENAVIDPLHNLFVIAGCSSCSGGGLWSIPLPAGNTLTSHGAPASCNGLQNGTQTSQGGVGNSPGLAWDPVQKIIVGWSDDGHVYLLSDANYTCTTLTYPNGPPGQGSTGDAYAGLWGHFRYFPNLNLFVAVDSVDNHVYALRLTNGIH